MAEVVFAQVQPILMVLVMLLIVAAVPTPIGIMVAAVAEDRVITMADQHLPARAVLLLPEDAGAVGLIVVPALVGKLRRKVAITSQLPVAAAGFIGMLVLAHAVRVVLHRPVDQVEEQVQAVERAVGLVRQATTGCLKMEVGACLTGLRVPLRALQLQLQLLLAPLLLQLSLLRHLLQLLQLRLVRLLHRPLKLLHSLQHQSRRLHLNEDC